MKIWRIRFSYAFRVALRTLRSQIRMAGISTEIVKLYQHKVRM
jgi:hypothetical protein